MTEPTFRHSDYNRASGIYDSLYSPPGDQYGDMLSVTSILKRLYKVKLEKHKQKIIIKYMLDNYDKFHALADDEDHREMVETAALKAPSKPEYNQYATQRGTDLHDRLENYLLTNEYDTEGLIDLDAAKLEKAIEFFDTQGFKVTDTEITVFHEDYGHCGTIDVVAEKDGERWVIDLKTGRGTEAWPDNALQVQAYMVATHILHDDGTVDPFPKVDKGAILHVGTARNKEDQPETVDWHFHELKDSEWLFDVFHSLHKVAKWNRMWASSFFTKPYTGKKFRQGKQRGE